MTRNKAAKMLQLIQDFSEGKNVQYYDSMEIIGTFTRGCWKTATDLSLGLGLNYYRLVGINGEIIYYGQPIYENNPKYKYCDSDEFNNSAEFNRRWYKELLPVIQDYAGGECVEFFDRRQVIGEFGIGCWKTPGELDEVGFRAPLSYYRVTKNNILIYYCKPEIFKYFPKY